MKIDIHKLMNDPKTETTEFDCIDGVDDSFEAVIYCFSQGFDIIVDCYNSVFINTKYLATATDLGEYKVDLNEIANDLTIFDIYIQTETERVEIENKEEVKTYLKNWINE